MEVGLEEYEWFCRKLPLMPQAAGHVQPQDLYLHFCRYFQFPGSSQF